MKNIKDKLEDRLKASQLSKQAMLARIANRPGQDEESLRKKQEERQAILKARETRQAAAELRRQEAAAALELRAREQAQLEEERRAQAALDAAHASEREAELKIQQKMARDARYAARKARR